MRTTVFTRGGGLLAAALAAGTLGLSGCAGALGDLADSGSQAVPVTSAKPGATTTAATTVAAEVTTTTKKAAAKGAACDLLSKEEAEAITGVELQDGVEGPANNPSCTYTAPPTGRTAQVQLFLGEGAANYYDAEKRLGHEITELPGIGDEAYAEDNAVFVRQGGTWIALILVLLDDPTTTAPRLTHAAEVLAGRI